MKTTMTLSSNLNCSIFDIFNQDVDEVIMIINYYLLLGEEEENTQKQSTTKTKAPTRPAASKEVRIKVNDATASGGWF